MRTVSWNVAHQTRLSPTHPQLAMAISALEPDVFFLNEYVHDGRMREAFLEDLKKVGLVHVVVSKHVPRPGRGGRNNQVVAASRFPLRVGDLSGPVMPDNGGGTNFLHVVIDEIGLELVGLRVPAYGSADLIMYWDAFALLARDAIGRRIVFMGDFNADPNRNAHMDAKRFAGLRNQGWQIPEVSGDWSFKSGTRIDHALASPEVAITGARYVSSIGDLVLAGGDVSTAISDHAALVVDVAAKLE